jgi:aminoglycoside/choline kinase family phosphotransferase
MPATADASFRRYFRTAAGGQSYIVMDAPPEREDSSRFVTLSGYLRQMGLNCPRIIHADLKQGFLIISDLGHRQYLGELNRNPAATTPLYQDAMAALLTLQSAGRAFQQKLPPYDDDLLRFELSIFTEWLCGRHLGIEFDRGELLQWQNCCDTLVRSALAQPRVFVHRDFHSRNLMLTPDNNPGILDFQDALEGPLTYDLVSLLRDCYLELPVQTVQEWVRDFVDNLPEDLPDRPGADEFTMRFDLMGAQRHLKAAGIFARLLHRDGKTEYMKDVPRTLGYVSRVAETHDDLGFLKTLIDERCLPRLGELA